MPELDYAILCDYVRAEGGAAHIIAASIDTLRTQELPHGFNLAIAARVLFSRQECGRPHRLEFIVQDQDGRRLGNLTGTIEPEWSDDLPTHWKAPSVLPLRFGMGFEHEGIYSIEVLLNDSLVKSIPFRVVLLPSADQ